MHHQKRDCPILIGPLRTVSPTEFLNAVINDDMKDAFKVSLVA
jgi:hypothetical protein